MGVRVIRLDEDDRVVSVARAEAVDESEIDDAEEGDAVEVAAAGDTHDTDHPEQSDDAVEPSVDGD